MTVSEQITDSVDKLEQLYAAISELGSLLTEVQWKTPSDLPGWTVQDNLSHLIGTERMLQGLSAAQHRAAATDHVKNPIGEFNEHEVDMRRGLPGARVLAEWNELAATRLATLRAGDEAYFATPAMMPTGPGTVGDFLHIRILDLWSHEQDMRRAVGMPYAMHTASAAHTVDRLIRTLPIVVGKRAKTAEGDAVLVHLTGDVERALTYQVIDGRATLVDQSTSPVVTTVRMPCDVFATLSLGRVPASTLADQITIEGDTDLGRRVVDHLNMMI